MTHLSAILIELDRQVGGVSKLIGVGLQARIDKAEAQVGRLAKIGGSISSKLLHIEMVLPCLLDDDVIDGQVPRPIVGHAVEAHIIGAGTCGLEHA